VESATPPLVPLQERSRAFVPTPGQQGGRHGSLGDEEGWCLDVAHDAFWASVSTNRGWVVRQGGAGGKKQWLEANATGQVLELFLNGKGRTLALEYYQHDSAPMGMLETSITLHRREKDATPEVDIEGRGVQDGKTAQRAKWSNSTLGPVLVDGVCLDCFRHQGFYKSVIIGKDLPERNSTTVRMVVVPRSDGRAGSTFNIVGILAYY